jgi:hypothetical protein
VGLKLPKESVVKLTVPAGEVGDEDVSVTVAVHVLAVPTVTEPGKHAMDEEVERGVITLRLKLPWLAECEESPPYMPVIM